MANNHAVDQGQAGLLDAIRRVKATGVKVVGVGRDAAAARKPAIVRTSSGATIGFLGWTDIIWPGYEAGSGPGVATARTDMGLVTQAIRRLKARVDYVVVCFHWGIEYTDMPIAAQVSEAHAAIDAGADLVIGHHPHVLQGAQLYKGHFIIDSLGDLVFDHYSLATVQTGRFRRPVAARRQGDADPGVRLVERHPRDRHGRRRTCDTASHAADLRSSRHQTEDLRRSRLRALGRRVTRRPAHDPGLLSPGPSHHLQLRGDGPAALVAACYVAYRLLRTRGVSFEFAYELLFVAGLGGFAGARIYYLVQHWAAVKGDLLHNTFSGSGFTWYGGLIGGFVCVALWSRFGTCRWASWRTPPDRPWRWATPWGASAACSRATATTAAPPGRSSASPFHGTVPTPPGIKVWPTPLMETIAMLVVCWVLYRMAKKPQPGWYVWGWFMVLAGIERLLIEFDMPQPGGLSGPAHDPMGIDRQRGDRCRRHLLRAWSGARGGVAEPAGGGPQPGKAGRGGQSRAGGRKDCRKGRLGQQERLRGQERLGGQERLRSQSAGPQAVEGWAPSRLTAARAGS